MPRGGRANNMDKHPEKVYSGTRVWGVGKGKGKGVGIEGGGQGDVEITGEERMEERMGKRRRETK